ncbi:MAG: hypothetical protein LC769_09560 [Chloroflexi bacterium]|nr:hypothetical protein [Chloroflexota bacterium]
MVTDTGDTGADAGDTGVGAGDTLLHAHLQPLGSPRVCGTCGATFTTEPQLAAHLEHAYHGVQCLACGAVYATRDAFEDHIRRAHSSPRAPRHAGGGDARRQQRAPTCSTHRIVSGTALATYLNAI